nr:PREDICTED: uncharacterized protein LOC103973132 isoform X1 [Musa acuminata subsp. malaccensis]
MESLCGSGITSGWIEASVAHLPERLSRVGAPTLRLGLHGDRGKFASLMLWSPPPSPQKWGRRWRVLAHEASGGCGENNGVPTNGFNVLINDGRAFPENDSVQDGSHESCISEKKEMVQPVAVGSGTTGSKAGLFRTPISGGVQSATTVHGLPPPALAVRNLMEQINADDIHSFFLCSSCQKTKAKFGQLCTIMSGMHHHRAGYPVGSLVDFAPDSMGHPIFSFSPLAIHTRNLLANSKCSLVVQIPGWSSLSNARVTIFGDVFPLAADEQEWARQQFVAKHQQWASQQWGNFYYYRMQNISDIYFIGGFGTVAWVDVKEYEGLKPDKIAADSGEQNLKELNAIFSKPIKDILSTETEIDDAAFISVDSKGTDVRVRQGAQFNIQRISFEVEHEVQTLDEAKAALQKIIDRSCSSMSQKGN